jgi:multiple sugar transport system ATP-binding protein
MASLTIRGLTKDFGDVRAVDDLNLDIADGEFLVLLGPSGAGKTTTLRLIAGLETPTRGRVEMDGVDVTMWRPAQRDCAFVFQQYSLYPHLSVYDNIAFPLRSPLRRTDEVAIRRKVEEVAALLHIESKLQCKSTALSGGEMQRVAIGRALVREPRVFLMDEPLSSLDAKLREELRVELRRIQKRLGVTFVYVTHDQVEATTMADRVGTLERGVLQQVGTPHDVYTDPDTIHVAQRLGSPAINVVPSMWFADDAVPLPARSVGIRPEDLAFNDARGVACRVVEHSLVKHLLVAERDGTELRATVMLDHALPSGTEIRLGFPARQRLYFDLEGRRIRAAAETVRTGAAFLRTATP